MTKFEEKLEKLPIKTIQHPVGNTKYYTAVHVKSLIAQADEEFQELKEQHGNQAESILLMLDEIKSLKSQLQQQALPVVPECVAGAIESIPDHYSAFEAIELIKSKVETLPEENKDWLQVYNWLCEGVENQDTFSLAFITGKYEVEKPQLFYLKHIDMSKSDAHLNWYLAKGTDNVLIHQGLKKGISPKLKCILKLTQQEIDSMQTGSYEQIDVPVEDGE